METDTFVQKTTLQPYQPMFFIEDYSNGEPSTTIDIKSQGRPKLMMLLNDVEEYNISNYLREENTKDSQILLLTSWIKDAESKSFDIEHKYMYLCLINLSGQTVDLSLTVGSKRIVTYRNKIKYLLYHL